VAHNSKGKPSQSVTKGKPRLSVTKGKPSLSVANNMEQQFLAAAVATVPSTASLIRRYKDPGYSRFLKDEDNNKNGANAKTSYLVDASGNAYEPYALSWRYLGMYADCDLTYAMRSVDGLSRRRNRGRKLGGDGGGGNNNNGGNDQECSRKVLWAAVCFQ
jgi:hypothetical protein